MCPMTAGELPIAEPKPSQGVAGHRCRLHGAAEQRPAHALGIGMAFSFEHWPEDSRIATGLARAFKILQAMRRRDHATRFVKTGVIIGQGIKVT